jgi:hypothetical protein
MAEAMTAGVMFTFSFFVRQFSAVDSSLRNYGLNLSSDISILSSSIQLRCRAYIYKSGHGEKNIR